MLSARQRVHLRCCLLDQVSLSLFFSLACVMVSMPLTVFPLIEAGPEIQATVLTAFVLLQLLSQI